MASRYTLLALPSSDGTQPTSNTHNNVDYELGSIRRYEPERYEPFPSQPRAPYTSPSLTEDYSYRPYQSDVPALRTPVSSISHPTSKTAVASATSLTSQHDHETQKTGLVDTAPALRTTLVSWLLEIFAVTISVGSLLAIVAILRHEDGRPFSAWSLAVTLNTVIAALGTLGRTTLAFALSACVGQQKWNWLRKRSDRLVAWERFDEASRGPWGATRLFIWLRARYDISNLTSHISLHFYRHWAALGALVIIGTVAFDPFLQAVLSTYGRLDIDHLTQDMAHVQQALVVDAGTLMVRNGGPVMSVETSSGLLQMVGSGFTQPDFGMISAIYNGFYNNTSWYRDEQAVNNFCATGNCTWPLFTSAAVCSSCNDVSNKFVIRKGASDWNQDWANIPLPSNLKSFVNYTAFTLPYANISNADAASYKDPRWKHREGTDATLLTANTTIDPRQTMTSQDLETLMMAFTIIRVSEDWIQGKAGWNASQPVATECALYLCANVYEAESRSSKFRETLLHSWAMRDPFSYQADATLGTFNEGPAADAYVADHGPQLYDDLIPRTDLRLVIPTNSPEDYAKVQPRIFNVSYPFIKSTTRFLLSFTAGREDVGQMAFPAWDGGMSPLIDAIWDSKNITETFDHVARSLTNQMRNAAANATNIAQVIGTTQKWVTHVRVDWAYLIFPITTISLGVIYVLLTIIESTRLHIPVWKESALPSLLHGLDNETQSLLRDAQAQSDGTELGETTFRFGYDEKDDCLRLIAEHDTPR